MATKIEIATMENTGVARNLTADLKVISKQLQENRTNGTADFTLINEVFPLKSMDAFDEVEVRVSSEVDFKELLVSFSSSIMHTLFTFSFNYIDIINLLFYKSKIQ